MECFTIDNALGLGSLITSIIACVYTYKTYRKSYDIFDIVEYDAKKRWNKKALESIFCFIPFDSIESFFSTPNIIRDELWQGLRKVDLNMFQFDGEEKNLIINFINELDNFCLMKYERTPSNHWKYKPLSDKEEGNADKEKKEMDYLNKKAKELRPLYDEVKKVLSKYQIDMTTLNNKAHALYIEQQEKREEYN